MNLLERLDRGWRTRRSIWWWSTPCPHRRQTCRPARGAVAGNGKCRPVGPCFDADPFPADRLRSRRCNRLFLIQTKPIRITMNNWRVFERGLTLIWRQEVVVDDFLVMSMSLRLAVKDERHCVAVARQKSIDTQKTNKNGWDLQPFKRSECKVLVLVKRELVCWILSFLHKQILSWFSA